jgi:hypothetical protein
MIAETRDLLKHLHEFQENGYTIFPGLFDQAQLTEWGGVYYRLRQELFGDEPRNSYCIKNMVERAPKDMLTITANPVILDFLEALMGPFIQIGDCNFNGFAPLPKEQVAGKVSGWHRDMYGFAPKGTDYQIPRQVLALTYLEDMTEAFGPLRVIPGSHRSETYIHPDDKFKPHPDEVVLSLKAGDTIVFSGILHSGTPNTSGQHRIFIGGMYTYIWYRPTANFDGPNCLQLIKLATKNNDRRLLRLLGVNGQLEKQRANSGFIVPNEEKWKEWVEEDKAALNGPVDWWKEPIHSGIG